jgi:hypothetical protein
MVQLFKIIKAIDYYILLTWVIALFQINKSKYYRLIFFVLSVSLITIITTIGFILCKLNFTIIFNLSFIVHNTLWIYLLYVINKSYNFFLYLIAFYTIFSVFNLFFIEKFNLNYYTFILGSVIYVVLFLFLSFEYLKKEILDYFVSNNYIIMFAPILFFLGFSFMFSFRELNLRKTILFYNITLYNFISNFVNIIYYSLINLYIYREWRDRKKVKATEKDLI